ncbi:hypothetical protein CEXT_796121 [Caerostris extrusa]|uniref:Uncharacterized protein n=1 Tax=Caerostris extrusa TaxID=172846 RepID=A0AAV4NB67_CAEEX|nr:hypothetical protein CEXT_796121 [Caerostris extrusa]
MIKIIIILPILTAKHSNNLKKTSLKNQHFRVYLSVFPRNTAHTAILRCTKPEQTIASKIVFLHVNFPPKTVNLVPPSHLECNREAPPPPPVPEAPTKLVLVFVSALSSLILQRSELNTAAYFFLCLLVVPEVLIPVGTYLKSSQQRKTDRCYYGWRVNKPRS